MYSFFFSFPLSSFLHCNFFFAKAAAAGTRSASQMTHSLNIRRRRRSARFVPMYPQVLLAAGALAKMTTTTNTTEKRSAPQKRRLNRFWLPFPFFQLQSPRRCTPAFALLEQLDSTRPRSGAVEPVEPTEADRALTKLSQPPQQRVVMGGGVPTTTTTTLMTICGQRSARLALYLCV